MITTKAIGDLLFSHNDESGAVIISNVAGSEYVTIPSFYDLEQFVRKVQEEKMRKG